MVGSETLPTSGFPVVRARLTGRWKNTPLFKAGEPGPVVAPRVLDAQERQRAYDAVKQARPAQA